MRGGGQSLPCMALYCMGVMCSKPGGGTSQYLRTFFFFSWRGERLGEGGGESGAGRPQSDQRWACKSPKVPLGSPAQLGSLQEGEDPAQGRAQARGGCYCKAGGLSPVLGPGLDEDRAGGTAGREAKGTDVRVEGAGREAHINPPCSSLAPLVKGLLGGGRERCGEG